MKKIFLYALMLFSGFSCISCSDDEKGMANIDREWMTMFICDNNRGKGDDYAYNCKAEGPNGNDIHLYWYGVNNCADRKSTRLNSSHIEESRMPSSA